MTNVKNLAATLEFNEEAQIMAIKSNMPRDVYGLCMQYNTLDELKNSSLNCLRSLQYHPLLQQQKLQHSLWENMSIMMWSQLLLMKFLLFNIRLGE